MGCIWCLEVSEQKGLNTNANDHSFENCACKKLFLALDIWHSQKIPIKPIDICGWATTSGMNTLNYKAQQKQQWHYFHECLRHTSPCSGSTLHFFLTSPRSLNEKGPLYGSSSGSTAVTLTHDDLSLWHMSKVFTIRDGALSFSRAM